MPDGPPPNMLDSRDPDAWPNRPYKPLSPQNSVWEVINQIQMMKMEKDMMKNMLKQYDHTDLYFALGVLLVIGLLIYAMVFGKKDKDGSDDDGDSEDENSRRNRKIKQKRKRKVRNQKMAPGIQSLLEDIEAQRSNKKRSSLHIITAEEAQALLNDQNSSVTISKGVPRAPNPPSDGIF